MLFTLSVLIYSFRDNGLFFKIYFVFVCIFLTWCIHEFILYMYTCVHNIIIQFFLDPLSQIKIKIYLSLTDTMHNTAK